MSRVWNFRPSRADKNTKILVSKCDICGEPVKEGLHDTEGRTGTLREIGYDKDEPRLMVCDHCQKEYLISGYKIN
jgi:hypothetical protein